MCVCVCFYYLIILSLTSVYRGLSCYLFWALCMCVCACHFFLFVFLAGCGQVRQHPARSSSTHPHAAAEPISHASRGDTDAHKRHKEHPASHSLRGTLNTIIRVNII